MTELDNAQATEGVADRSVNVTLEGRVSDHGKNEAVIVFGDGSEIVIATTEHVNAEYVDAVTAAEPA